MENVSNLHHVSLLFWKTQQFDIQNQPSLKKENHFATFRKQCLRSVVIKHWLVCSLEWVIQSPYIVKPGKTSGYYLRRPEKIRQCEYLSIIKIMICSCFPSNKQWTRCLGYVVLHCHLLDILGNNTVTTFDRLIIQSVHTGISFIPT